MRTSPDTSADTLPTLGAPIKPAAKPAPAPTPVAPGVLRGADGKVHTDLPEPSWAAPVYVLSPEELAGLDDAQAAIADWLHF